MNCEGPYLTEGFLHNFCPCLDIVFAPLELITRTSIKIVEIVVTSEPYLIINHFKKYGIKEPAVPNTLSHKTSWRQNVNEKRKKFIVTSLQYYQFQQDGCKNRIFFREKEVEYKRLVKYLENLGYWENLLLSWMKHLLIFILWVVIFTQEKTPQQTFTCLEWTIATLEKGVKYVQS